ncbi:MAG: SET domain-containing protein-lysine N-methyltransferase [Ginsengibacter sp.]
MALLEKQLLIKRSKIPGAGKGLFTKKFIPKGTRIIEYKGKITTWKDVLSGDEFNGYVYYVTRNHVIDAMARKNSLGRYANDARGLSKIKGLVNNTRYVEDGKKVFMEAVKNIPEQTEILVSYGKEYWGVINENKKIHEREQKLKQKSNLKLSKSASRSAR